MKLLFTSILLIMLSLSLSAQDPVHRIWQEVDSIQGMSKALEESRGISPWSFHNSVGTMYTMSPLYGSMLSTYVAPHVDYAASQRLSFHGALLASYNTGLGLQYGEESAMFPAFSNFSIVAAASYRLSENLVLHGAGIKSFPVYPGEGFSSRYNYNSFSFGATYHIGNFSIGASFHQGGNSPFGPMSPGSYFGTPYIW